MRNLPSIDPVLLSTVSGGAVTKSSDAPWDKKKRAGDVDLAKLADQASRDPNVIIGKTAVTSVIKAISKPRGTGIGISSVPWYPLVANSVKIPQSA